MSVRFAFYGRVSTEDQQDPESSRNWQVARATALVERHGQIVTEFSTSASPGPSPGSAGRGRRRCWVR